MAERSKGLGAFAQAFGQSYRMGSQIAARQQEQAVQLKARQQELGAQMAWREQKEKTRQRERGADLSSEAKRRAEDLARIATTRKEDVGFRQSQADRSATQFEETKAFQRDEGRRGRASAERIAKLRAGKSVFDISKRSVLSTAQNMQQTIKADQSVPEKIKLPESRAVHEYYVEGRLTPKTLGSLVRAYEATFDPLPEGSKRDRTKEKPFQEAFYREVLTWLGITQIKPISSTISLVE